MTRRFDWLSVSTLALMMAVGAAHSAPSPTPFLDFPLATQTAAAKKADAFAWLVRQSDQTKVMFAAAPDFKARTLFSKSDHDGQPVGEVTVSADGRFVVYATASTFGGDQVYNPASLLDPPPATLWVIATEPGSTARRIGAGSSPLFTPEGSRFFYKQGKDLHLVDPAGSVIEDTVFAKNGAAFSDIQWAPDGQSIAFVQSRGGYSFIGLFRPGADRVQWLVTPPNLIDALVWSPDGKRIAYRKYPGREHTVTYDLTANTPLAIGVVEVESGRDQTLWSTTQLAASSALDDVDVALRWAGNDRLVFHSEHEGWARLYSLTLAGGEPKALTPPNCEVAESESPGSRELFVLHNCSDLHARQASLLDPQSGGMKALKLPDVVLANASAAPGRRFVAYTGGDAENAPLLRILDTQTRKVVYREEPSAHGYQRTFSAGAPKVVSFKAEDGVTVPAQLFLPKSKGKHPALVYVHGGPPRQMFPGFHFSSYYAFDFAFNRRLAELGYVVLAVNYRSGVGYGQGFREAPERAWRGASEYRDVLAAGRWLAERPEVNPKQIGIYGGSYGGLLTAQALSRNSDLFAAGVSIHGVYDWSWPSSKPGHLNPSRFFGVSESDRALAFKSSPISAVDTWKSPVLLFSGDTDMNVDVLETVDLTTKLTARGVKVDTVLLPGEAHGFIQQASWVRLWTELSAFFSKTLPASQ